MTDSTTRVDAAACREAADAVRMVAARASQRLIARFDLVEDESVPERIRGARGTWNGTSVQLEARFSSGAGPIARVHHVVGSSDDDVFASLTLLALGAAGDALPTLAVDLVAFRGLFVVVALDLAPVAGVVVAPLDPAQNPILSLHANRLGGSSEQAPVPDHLRDVVSPGYVLVGRAAPPAVLDAAVTWIDAYAQEAEHPTRDRPTAAAAPDAARRLYLERMRQDGRQVRTLAALFGEEWSHEFVRGWLFDPEVVARGG